MTVEKFLELAQALERALASEQWQLAEDLLEERRRILESLQPGSLDEPSRTQIQAIDARCMKRLTEVQSDLLLEAKRRQRVAQYGLKDR